MVNGEKVCWVVRVRCHTRTHTHTFFFLVPSPFLLRMRSLPGLGLGLAMTQRLWRRCFGKGEERGDERERGESWLVVRGDSVDKAPPGLFLFSQMSCLSFVTHGTHTRTSSPKHRPWKWQEPKTPATATHPPSLKHLCTLCSLALSRLSLASLCSLSLFLIKGSSSR